MGQIVKDVVVTEIAARVPPIPAQPAIACKVYGPPLPKGWRYRDPPATGSAFLQWACRYQATTPTSTPTVTTSYAPFTGSMTIPYNPSTQTVRLLTDGNGNPIKWEIRTTSYASGSVPDTVNYYSNAAGMGTITFPASDTAWNGYPLGPNGSVHVGQVKIGGITYTANFIKDSNGFMQNRDAFAAIPDTQARPAHGLIAQIDVPFKPAVPAVPAVYDTDYRVGWNAGADSYDVLDGDVHVVFEPAILAAGAVGFTQERGDVGDPATLSHAFYFDNDPTTGRKRFCAIESGRRVSGYTEYDAGIAFEIKRLGVYGEVTYHYDSNLIATSAAPLYGAVRVGTSLYRAGDGVL